MDENICAYSVDPNSTTNNCRLVPTPAPIRPSSGAEDFILPHDLNEELAPPLSKRGRGRPLGSKNRKNKPILVGEGVDNIIQIILIDAGNDIVESLLNSAQHHNASITVLSASGLISDVTLLHHVSCAPAFPVKGTFSIISLEGTYYNPNCARVPPQFITNPSCSSFSIHLASAEGNVFCGTIGGKVKVAGQVMVTSILFKKPTFYEMNLINRNIEEVEEDNERYVAGVISNQDRVVVEPNSVNNSVEGANSAPLNHKSPL